jgi:surfeit locus 1 family protein
MADIPSSASTRAGRPRRAVARTVVTALLALVFFAGFSSLGVWQLHRRAWKLDLIAKTEQRVHLAAVDAPGLAQWPDVNAAADEYRHVRAAGTFLYDHETLVQAATDYGSGYWVLTPLRLADGGLVLVNRGFVLPEWRKRADRAEPAGEAVVTGLMRMDEPGGAFLRHNDPRADLWYTRDLQAIAAARGLGKVAPYFIDADAVPAGKPDPLAAPVGGLTVVSFPNNHLSYAFTWFALAALTLVAAWLVGRDARGRKGSQVLETHLSPGATASLPNNAETKPSRAAR